MNAIEATQDSESRIAEALQELREMILSQYPHATFSTRHGDDPAGVYLQVEVDTANLTDIVYIVLDRLVKMQVDEGLPIELVPARPIHREIANLSLSDRAAGDIREWLSREVP